MYLCMGGGSVQLLSCLAIVCVCKRLSVPVSVCG